MAVNDTTPSVQYTATASQTTFAYPFEIFKDADLKVYQVSSSGTPDDTTDLLTLTTHYTVTGAGVDTGGNVVLVTGATVGDVITIKRDLAVKRTTDYQNLGDLKSASFNDDLDGLVMMVQQNEEAFGRAISLQESTQTPTTFNIDDPVAEYYAVAKADLSGIKWIQLLSAGDLSVSAFAETYLDDTTAAETLTTLGAANLTAANTFTKIQKLAKGVDVASAAALTLGTDGNSFDVTGTAAITSIDTVGIGSHITLQFDGILTLTHHATDLILPGAANITTAAGDIAVLYEYATGDWRCVSYARASAAPLTYEEGTWTPALQDTDFSDAEGQTYSLQTGVYTKIGNRLFFSGRIVLTSVGTLSGSSYINGLPETAAALATPVSVMGTNLNITAGHSLAGGITTLGRIELSVWDAAAGVTIMQISEITGNATLRFSGSYEIG